MLFSSVRSSIHLFCGLPVAAAFFFFTPMNNAEKPIFMTDTTRYTKEIYYYGTEGQQPKQIALSAGPLRLVYEAGNLRYIRLGGTPLGQPGGSNQEVVRMIYPTVRDRNWV